THQLGAINFGAAKGLGLLGDLSGVEQRVIPTERYVAGGYCETTRVRRTLDDRPPFRVTLDPRQLDELVRLSEIGAAAGARVLWVSHPLPADHLRALENRAAIHHAIRETAERAGVVYRSYEDLDLDPLADFFDFHHLNAHGVERFNRALLADLERP
ncbi:MAG: hypothetical protein KC731_27690, partial [Myxococcales bacterium]|nr:hypothetical protein [Myxococcales bacterium]